MYHGEARLKLGRLLDDDTLDSCLSLYRITAIFVSPFGIPRRENGEGIIELNFCVTARTLA